MNMDEFVTRKGFYTSSREHMRDRFDKDFSLRHEQRIVYYKHKGPITVQRAPWLQAGIVMFNKRRSKS